jgi:hypothetical protein
MVPGWRGGVNSWESVPTFRCLAAPIGRTHFPELVGRYEAELAKRLGTFRLDRVTKAVERSSLDPTSLNRLRCPFALPRVSLSTHHVRGHAVTSRRRTRMNVELGRDL